MTEMVCILHDLISGGRILSNLSGAINWLKYLVFKSVFAYNKIINNQVTKSTHILNEQNVWLTHCIVHTLLNNVTFDRNYKYIAASVDVSVSIFIEIRFRIQNTNSAQRLSTNCIIIKSLLSHNLLERFFLEIFC